MRRTERLFQIIQILRSARRPVTAAQLARELETSVRTIYRDMAELLAQRLPIRGEAGVGYALGPGYDMPPLMLTPDEIEVLVLGAQWVRAHGDEALQRGARDLIGKIKAVVPSRLRPLVLESTGMAASFCPQQDDRLDVPAVRAAIRAEQKLHIDYRDQHGVGTRRTVWPLAIAYFETVRLLVAWCELREAFRHFRTDRIDTCDFLGERYPDHRRAVLGRWRRAREEEDRRERLRRS